MSFDTLIGVALRSAAEGYARTARMGLPTLGADGSRSYSWDEREPRPDGTTEVTACWAVVHPDGRTYQEGIRGVSSADLI